ncbi:MAG: hypothetical protein ACPF9D_04790 [Owenweeksia sp.]
MKKLFFALLAFFAVACTTTRQEEVSKLKAEVLEVHDRVMVQRDEVLKLRRQLREVADSSAATLEAAGQLSAADKAMMQWMHEFKVPEEKTSAPEDIISYLQSEKKKMEAIEKQTEMALKHGEEILANASPAGAQEEEQ